MADTMLANPATGDIAILGREHVRADLAVPWYLKRLAPGKRLLIISVEDVASEKYLVGANWGGPDISHTTTTDNPYDYIITLPSTQTPVDQCAVFKAAARTSQ